MSATMRCGSLILKTAFFCSMVGFLPTATAKEGMWVPATLKSREADMKANGLEIPVEQLYNENGTGLNNAIVLFGKGCTGELISSKGLLLTNHHCGYGTVQGLSSKEHDYFAAGFWAKNMKEELPCPGLTVTFVRKMENVTDKILFGIADTLSEIGRDSLISVRIKNLERGFKFASGYDANIKPYYNGNQYWVALTETFRDIRLVGFPPNGIGSFGGDADNWMFPRHTGDFSMFRIYSNKANKPADYSKDNKPYNPQQFFTINTSGYKEGDFTMVYGFPAYTNEYISSYQLNQVLNITDPVRISVRTIRLNIWKEHMQNDRSVFLKYTSKRAGVANGWKKWQGEVRGLGRNGVLGIKQDYEKLFQAWAAKDEMVPYADELISQIGAKSLAVNELLKADEYIKEAVYGVELIPQGAALNKILQLYRSGKANADTLAKLADSWNGFYRNYDAATDKDVFIALMPMYFEKCEGYIPGAFTLQYAEQGSDYAKWADYVFSSPAADAAKLRQLALSGNPADTLKILGDPVWQLYTGVSNYRKYHVLPVLSKYNEDMAYLNRLYMSAQMKLDRSKAFYPDANFTLRLTYGNVEGIDPAGPAPYAFQTNLDEAVAKHNPNVEEFNMPQKLRDLYQAKDYGRWAVNGTVPIAFTAINHTSGGNSGSPVLNAKGQLIGTNFDRVWEGTMSDLYFDPRVCRNITLDVRYTLFIIEKFGGAGWLLKEMKIVQK